MKTLSIKSAVLTALLGGLTLGSSATQAATTLELRGPDTVLNNSDFDISVYFVSGSDWFANGDFKLAITPGLANFVSWTAGPGVVPFSAPTNSTASFSAPFTGNLADAGGGLLLGTAKLHAVSLGTTVLSFDPAKLMLFAAPGQTDFGTQLDNGAITQIGHSVQINAVPVPAPIWLISSALAGIACVSRRASKSDRNA